MNCLSFISQMFAVMHRYMAQLTDPTGDYAFKLANQQKISKITPGRELFFCDNYSRKSYLTKVSN